MAKLDQFSWTPRQQVRELQPPILARDVGFCYTDSLTECLSPEDKEYGEQRLMPAVVQARTKPPDEAKTDIIGAAHDLYSTRPLDEDITFMVWRRRSSFIAYIS